MELAEFAEVRCEKLHADFEAAESFVSRRSVQRDTMDSGASFQWRQRAHSDVTSFFCETLLDRNIGPRYFL